MPKASFDFPPTSQMANFTKYGGGVSKVYTDFSYAFLALWYWEKNKGRTELATPIDSIEKVLEWY
jgi:hypothetical protein